MEQAVKRFTDNTDLTFIPGENMNVYIFEVLSGDEAVMKLLETGFFDGTEKFIRKTSTKGCGGKWCDHIYTIIYNDGHSYSWECSFSESTCISNKTRMEQKIIDSAIELLLN